MAMNWDIKGNVDWDFPLSFAPFFFLRKCSMKCAYLLIRSLVEILEMVFTPGTSFLPGPKRTLEVLFLKFATFQIGIRPYGGEQKCRNFSIIFKCNILHFAKMGIFEKAGWKFCAWSIYLKDFVKSIAWAWSLIEWVPSEIYESGATSTPGPQVTKNGYVQINKNGLISTWYPTWVLEQQHDAPVSRYHRWVPQEPVLQIWDHYLISSQISTSTNLCSESGTRFKIMHHDILKSKKRRAKPEN